MNCPAPCILIASALYYPEVTGELCAGAQEVLDEAGATIRLVETTGAFELPCIIAMAAKNGGYDGYLALGCVIRGETSHYEHICAGVARGLMDLSLTGLAIGFGVLTCETREQALARALRSGGNKGAESARACLQMLALSRQFANESARIRG